MIHEIIKAKDNEIHCESSQAGDLCPNLPVEGEKYCAAHGGAKQAKDHEKENIRLYRLTKYNARLNEFTRHPDVKSLKDEIGILRILMEEKLNSIQSTTELLAHTHTISDIAIKIEKLVSSFHKLEKSMGNYLDKNTVVQLGMEIVKIITKYVKDEKAIDNIATDLNIVIQRILDESEDKII